MTRGIGQSDVAIHAGSYHMALHDAGISEFNIMYYSSILPAKASRIDRPENIAHGSVLETIMASHSCGVGETAAAGISYGWLYDKNTGEKYGGIVCEHGGNYGTNELISLLERSLFEIYDAQFSKFELRDVETHISSFVPEKKFGTAMVALCFVTYEFPEI